MVQGEIALCEFGNGSLAGKQMIGPCVKLDRKWDKE